MPIRPENVGRYPRNWATEIRPEILRRAGHRCENCGGEPEFRPAPQMSAAPLMHVKCQKCGDRTWFTEEQWWAIPAADAPKVA